MAHTGSVPFLRSSATRSVLLYAFGALVLSVVFSLLVYENQLDLISENAVLHALRAGIQLREQVEGVMERRSDWRDAVGALFRDQRSAGLTRATLFSEEGAVLLEMGRTGEVSDEELRLIHQALTRREFEGRPFTHVLDTGGRLVELYIPFRRRRRAPSVAPTPAP